jgi:hypothetical protein
LSIGGEVSTPKHRWLGRRWIDGRSFEWVGGLDDGGQRLYVVPREDLVVAVTAGVFKHSYSGTAGDTAIEMALRATIEH